MDRSVTVKLNIEMGETSDRSLKQLQRSIEAASKSQERLQQAALSAFSPVIQGATGARGALGAGGGVTGASGQFGGMGGVGGSMLSGVGRYVLPLLAADSLVRGGTSLGTLAHDRYLSDAQRGRRFFSEFVPGGDRIQRLVDSVSGRAAAMEQVSLRSDIRREEFGLQNQYAGQALGFAPQAAGLRERARQLAGANPVVLGQMDRTTATGERSFQEQSRLLPVRREIAKSERELAVAAKERMAAEGKLVEYQTRENSLIRDRNQAARELEKDNTSGAGRFQLAKRLDDINEQIEANRQLVQQAQQGVYGAKGKEAQATGQIGLNQARLTEERAGILETRAETAAGTARGLGGMRPGDRARALAAVEMLTSGQNPDMLPPQLLALAGQVAPQTTGKILETYSAKTPEAERLRQLAPADYGGDPEKLRRQAQDARDQAERERIGAEAGVARATSRAADEYAERIANIFAQALQRIEQRLETKLKVGRAGQ